MRTHFKQTHSVGASARQFTRLASSSKCMTLKQLEAFYWAASCQHFVQAAQRVHVSVSSLSKRIAELERSLGQLLFDRSGQRCVLTDAGRRLLPQATALLQQAQAVRQDMGAGEVWQGPCRLGVGELSAMTWLPRWVAALNRWQPDVNLQVQVDIGAHLLQALEQGGLDVAAVAGRVAHPRLMSRPLGTAQFAWCASPRLLNVATVADRDVPDRLWRENPWIVLPTGSGMSHVLDDWCQSTGLSPSRTWVCNHWGGVAGLLLQGLGVGLLPQSWAQAWAEQGALVCVQSPPTGPSTLALPYTLYWRRDDLRPGLLKVCELAIQQVNFEPPTAISGIMPTC